MHAHVQAQACMQMRAWDDSPMTDRAQGRPHRAASLARRPKLHLRARMHALRPTAECTPIYLLASGCVTIWRYQFADYIAVNNECRRDGLRGFGVRHTGSDGESSRASEVRPPPNDGGDGGRCTGKV